MSAALILPSSFAANGTSVVASDLALATPNPKEVTNKAGGLFTSTPSGSFNPGTQSSNATNGTDATGADTVALDITRTGADTTTVNIDFDVAGGVLTGGKGAIYEVLGIGDNGQGGGDAIQFKVGTTTPSIINVKKHDTRGCCWRWGKWCKPWCQWR
ncbi:hypothetical protein [Piscirickettsia litoralis]|uniref:hypothetical protein n=1 Tax=Piscirickettsia litoralis TaxID=1891921 RepID=UPI001113004E|nr:hypothetical protein [Piscirickettsia litoralis]